MTTSSSAQSLPLALKETGQLLAKGRLAEAGAMLERLRERAWDQGDFYRLRAELHVARHQYRAAVEDLVKANHILLGLVPLGDCVRIVLRDIGKNLSPGRFPKLASETDPYALLAAGNALRASGDNTAARTAYRAALTRVDQDSTLERALSLRLACLLASNGELTAADQLFASFGNAGGPESVVCLSENRLQQLARAADLHFEFAPPDLDGIEVHPGAALTVLVSADAGYFGRFAGQLCKALAGNAGLGVDVVFHVINPDDGTRQQLEAIRADVPQLGVHLLEQNLTIPPRVTAKTLYACARFLSARQLLAHVERPVLILDADLLVLKPLTPLQRLMRTADVGLFALEPARHDPWDAYQASVVWLEPTAATDALLRSVEAYIGNFLGVGQWVWYLDQIALFCAIAKHETSPGAESGICIEHFPREMLHLTGVTAHTARPTAAAVFWSLLMSIPANRALEGESLL